MDNRKFHRFDNSIFVEFRPSRKTGEYFSGVARNFSCAGFSFESQNYDLEPGEVLAFRIKHPRSDLSATVLGEILWNMKSESVCITGIKLKERDEATHSKMLEIISAAGNIYIDSLLYGEEYESVLRKREEEKFEEQSSEETERVSIKKQYLETSPACKVTFRLPKKAAPEARQVTIVGDFNDWDKERTLMKRLASGDFTVTLELNPGSEYKFKYLIDAHRWENDWHADKYIPCPHGYEDSVVVV